MAARLRVAAAVSACTALLLVAAVKQPIRKLSYDPDLPVVEVFEALDEGLLEATVIPRSAKEARLFITNKSAEAVTVKLPAALAAVHVLPQVQPQPGTGGPFDAGGQSAGTGPGQPVGGGIQSSTGTGTGQQQQPFGNPQGNFFFSIPSEKTIQVSLKTLCLAHGRPDPTSRMRYRLARLEDVTGGGALEGVVKAFAGGDVDSPVAQAAAWHLADEMTWKQLESKRIERLGGLPSKPYFTAKQIKAARELVEREEARLAATDRGEERQTSRRE